MADRASVLERTQIGIEATGTPGTAVTAARKLLTQSWALDPNLDFDRFRPEGHKFETLAAPIKEWVGGDIEGRGDYKELVYPFASVLCNPTGGAGVQIMDGATPTGAYRWTFTPGVDTADTVRTFTVEAGQSGTSFAQRSTYGLVTEFGLTLDRDGAVEVGGAWMGQALVDNVTLAAATALVSEPILITHVDIYMDTSSGALGTTKLTRVRSAEFNISDRTKPIWAINSAVAGYVGHVESNPTTELDLNLEADATGMALLTGAARTGATRYVRIAATGPTIYTGGVTVKNSLTIDLAVKVVDHGGFDDDDGITVAGYTLGVVEDPAWASGRALTVELVNTLATF